MSSLFEKNQKFLPAQLWCASYLSLCQDLLKQKSKYQQLYYGLSKPVQKRSPRTSCLPWRTTTGSRSVSQSTVSNVLKKK